MTDTETKVMLHSAYPRRPMQTTHAIDYIESMTTRPYEQKHPYCPDDIYDVGHWLIRDLLCSDDGSYSDYDGLVDEYKERPELKQYIPVIQEQLQYAYQSLLIDEYGKHFISTLALTYSVCPMHHCDYCACFDDDDPECALIREYFPSHDT